MHTITKASNPSPPARVFPILRLTLTLILLLIQIKQSYTLCAGGSNGCQRCVNSTHCAGCMDSYRLNSSLECQLCQVPGCVDCQFNGNLCWEGNVGTGVIAFVPVPCNVTYCGNCNDDINCCRKCFDFYGLIDCTTCLPCLVLHCKRCDGDPNICQECRPGTYLDVSANTCIGSHGSVLSCITSFAFTTCAVCNQGFGSISGTCIACFNKLCLRCDGDPTVCSICESRHGVSNGQCIPCSDVNCQTCSYNSNFCTGCHYQQWRGLDTVNGICAPCTLRCVYCHQNINNCTLCNTYSGVDLATGLCRSCEDTNCLHCGTDYLNCTTCKYGYGFDLVNGKICVACEDLNCHVCFHNYRICLQCFSGYGVLNGICQLCVNSPTFCLDCHPQVIRICTTCPLDRYLTPHSTCNQCPIYCASCFNNTATIECTTCFQNQTSQIYILELGLCTQIQCGDFIIHPLVEQCDNEVGYQYRYDGCTDNCTVEDGFVCNWDGNGSVCSYERVIGMEFRGFGGVEGRELENQCVVKVRVWPMLYVFSNSSQVQLMEIFGVESDSLQVYSIQYDTQTGTITFLCHLLTNIPKGTQLTITFTPHNSTKPQYAHTPPASLTFTSPKTLYFLSPSQVTITNLLPYVCYLICGLAWIAFLLGLFMRRLPGLEAIGVVQIGWACMVMFMGEMMVVFRGMAGLRWVNGFAVGVVGEGGSGDEVEDEQAPYFDVFKLSRNIFINNFNVLMILQILSIICIIVTNYRLKKFLQTYNPVQPQPSPQPSDPQPQPQQPPQSLQQLTSRITHTELSYQLLLSTTILALPPFTFCLALHLKHSTNIANIPSLVMIGIEFVIACYAYGRFLWDPAAFEYFRFSFGGSELAMRHYCVYVLVMGVLAGVVGGVGSSYAGLALTGGILVYTIVIRPYNEISENIRSIFNWLVTSSLLFYRVYIQYICSETQLNQNPSMLLFLINTIVLLPLTCIIAIIFTIYYYWYYNYKAVDESNDSKNKKLIQIQHYRRKLLGQLVRIDPNKAMENVKLDTTFRKLMNADASLLRVANQLIQIKKEKNQNGKYQLEDVQYLKKGLFDSGLNKNYLSVKKNRQIKQGSALDDKQQHAEEYKKCRQAIKSQIINKRQPIPRINTYNPSLFTQQPQPLTKDILSSSQQPVSAPLIVPTESSLLTVSCPTQLQNQIATRIMSTQTQYINLQAAILKTYQHMKEEIIDENIEEYDKIDAKFRNDVSIGISDQKNGDANTNQNTKKDQGAKDGENQNNPIQQDSH